MIRSFGLVVVLFAVSPVGAEEPSAPAFLGTVVDESDAPVAGATVEMLNETAGGDLGDPPDEPPTGKAKTASDGSFRLPIGGPPREESYGILRATAPDGGRVGLGAVLQKMTKPRPIRIVLGPARELAVRVTDGDGGPVADAEVRVLSSCAFVTGGRTDADGNWSGRVPSRMSWWTVVARKPGIGFDYQTGPSPKPYVPAELPPEVSLTLDGATAIQVKTVDRDGRPLAGVRLMTLDVRRPDREQSVSCYGSYREMVTGPDGAAVLDPLPAKFAKPIQIFAASRDWTMIKDPPRIDLNAGGRDITITMKPMSAISGLVTAADGSPAAGVAVKAFGRVSDRPMGRGFAVSDANGRYRMAIPADQIYLVAAVDEPAMRAAPYKDEVLVLAEQPAEGIDFTLGPATALTGRVTRADTTPASGVLISLSADFQGLVPSETLARLGVKSRFVGKVSENRETQTDADGRYRFVVGPGKYMLHMRAMKEPVKITVPVANPPDEITHDFAIPQSEAKPK